MAAHNAPVRPFSDMVKDAALVGVAALALAVPLVGFQTVDRAASIALD